MEPNMVKAPIAIKIRILILGSGNSARKKVREPISTLVVE